MQNRVFSCTCGNIRVNGHTVPHGLIPNIPGDQRPRGAQCATLLVVHPRAITVASGNAITTKQLSTACADIFCSTCHQGFRLFYGRRHSFIGRLPPNPESDHIERHDIPSILRPFLSLDSSRHGSFSETLEPVASDRGLCSRRSAMDADFEMMFGERGDVVVGSYKHSRVNREERFSVPYSDAIPNSYFA